MHGHEEVSVEAQPEKKCADCGIPKPLSDFYTSVRRNNHVETFGKCKQCHNRHVSNHRKEKIKKDPNYLQSERDRVAVYRGVETNRQRANNRSTANHEALSRLKARYPDEYDQHKTEQLEDPQLKRSVALYRATRELRDEHMQEYKELYREALKRRGVM